MPKEVQKQENNGGNNEKESRGTRVSAQSRMATCISPVRSSIFATMPKVKKALMKAPQKCSDAEMM
jgi:hypothetical protein